MSTMVGHEDDFYALHERLADLQMSQIAHRRRAIILIEGLPGSGKKAALRQIASSLDPCHFKVHAGLFDRREASEGHWLARYWRQLPGASDTAIFYRGWYRRVLDDHLLGRVDGKSVARAFDEINEFEAQQLDAGTVIAKMFFTVDPSVQRERLTERAQNRWRRTQTTDAPIYADSPAFIQAFEELRAHSDTRWSPWAIIDGSDADAAAHAALSALVGSWTKAMPSEPPHLVDSSRAA